MAWNQQGDLDYGIYAMERASSRRELVYQTNSLTEMKGYLNSLIFAPGKYDRVIVYHKGQKAIEGRIGA